MKNYEVGELLIHDRGQLGKTIALVTEDFGFQHVPEFIEAGVRPTGISTWLLCEVEPYLCDYEFPRQPTLLEIEDNPTYSRLEPAYLILANENSTTFTHTSSVKSNPSLIIGHTIKHIIHSDNRDEAYAFYNKVKDTLR